MHAQDESEASLAVKTLHNLSGRIPGRRERIGPGFVKYHIGPDTAAPWPLRPVLHHFTEPDAGPPHDHPWPFTTTICTGSYVEEVFTREGGVWRCDRILRQAGTTHSVPARHIHRIIDLPDGECFTLVIAGPRERRVRWWPQALTALEQPIDTREQGARSPAVEPPSPLV